MMASLNEKHDKWHGVSHADIDATTKMLRGLEPDSPIRVPLIRHVSDAHATPHRLQKMGIIATPHCPHCLCDNADISHVVWQCPRFQVLRQNWPENMFHRAEWSPCNSNSMICTTDLAPSEKLHWPEYQQHVVKLVFQWMELQRNRDLYEPFTVKQVPIHAETIPNLDCREACAQKYQHTDAMPLYLTWLLPSTCIASNQWGATPQDYNFLFSFWTKTTSDPDANLVRLSTWTQALAIFIQLGEMQRHSSPDAPTSQWPSLSPRCCPTAFSKTSLVLRSLLKTWILIVGKLNGLQYFPKRRPSQVASKFWPTGILLRLRPTFTCYICS